MRRHRPQDSSFEDIDEHDQPTEPMMPIVIAPFAPTQVNGTTQPAQASHYPNLPPAPIKKNKQQGQRPAGGAIPSSLPPVSPAFPVYPVLPARPVQKAQPRQSAIPPLVGVFFVAVQLLLLIRFLLKLLNISGNARWLNIVYDVSDVFVFPFRLLVQNTPLTFSLSIEVYTLLAILVYGLFSRILVRFLKALLNSR